MDEPIVIYLRERKAILEDIIAEAQAGLAGINSIITIIAELADGQARLRQKVEVPEKVGAG